MTAMESGMTLPDALAVRLSGKVVVVGIGNPMFGDDAAGCLVARRLTGTLGLLVIEAEDVPECYLGEIVAARPDVVVFVDAVDLGEAPGSTAVLQQDMLASYEASTHRVPLSLLAKLISRECGADVWVIAIQPRQVNLGATLSTEVAQAIVALSGLIRQSVPGSGTAFGVGTPLKRDTGPC
jgi:hydrogenase 3 maturation protease